MKYISEAQWSIGNKIHSNFPRLKEATTKAAVEAICREVIGEVTTKDTRKFWLDFQQCSTYSDAVTYCYNYYLAGLGLRIIK